MKTFTTEDLSVFAKWVREQQKALEWSVAERTFQIGGARGMEGCWERFFHAGAEHPTRSSVSDAEILIALQNATSPLKFWRNETDCLWFDSAQDALIAAREFCGSPWENWTAKATW